MDMTDNTPNEPRPNIDLSGIYAHLGAALTPLREQLQAMAERLDASQMQQLAMTVAWSIAPAVQQNPALAAQLQSFGQLTAVAVGPAITAFSGTGTLSTGSTLSAAATAAFSGTGTLTATGHPGNAIADAPAGHLTTTDGDVAADDTPSAGGGNTTRAVTDVGAALGGLSSISGLSSFVTEQLKDYGVDHVLAATLGLYVALAIGALATYMYITQARPRIGNDD